MVEGLKTKCKPRKGFWWPAILEIIFLMLISRDSFRVQKAADTDDEVIPLLGKNAFSFSREKSELRFTFCERALEETSCFR